MYTKIIPAAFAVALTIGIGTAAFASVPDAPLHEGPSLRGAASDALATAGEAPMVLAQRRQYESTGYNSNIRRRHANTPQTRVHGGVPQQAATQQLMALPPGFWNQQMSRQRLPTPGIWQMPYGRGFTNGIIRCGPGKAGCGR